MTNHSPVRSPRSTPAHSTPTRLAETAEAIVETTPVPIHTHISREGTITLTFGPDDAEAGLDIARQSKLTTPGARVSASANDSDASDQHGRSSVESSNAKMFAGAAAEETDASRRYLHVDVTAGRRQRTQKESTRKQKESTRTVQVRKQSKNEFYEILSGKKTPAM